MARVPGSSWLNAATKRVGSSQMNVSVHAPRLCGPTWKLTTLQIHFEMNGALREHRGGSRRNVVEHESRPVFSEHSRSEGAVDRHIDFRGTWMCVWNVHAAGLEVAECWESLVGSLVEGRCKTTHSWLRHCQSQQGSFQSLLISFVLRPLSTYQLQRGS